jgi:hypothetical protein
MPGEKTFLLQQHATKRPQCGQRSAESSRHAANLTLIVVLSLCVCSAHTRMALSHCPENGGILLVNPS